MNVNTVTGRRRYAESLVWTPGYGRNFIPPTRDHLILLKKAHWGMSDIEFGAPEINPKRPYGNSDVEGDLEELLPLLTEEERLKVHCELPAVLAFLCTRAEPFEDD